MFWKQIPKEEPAPDKLQKTHLRKRLVQHNFEVNHPKISHRLLQSVSLRLFKFTKKESKHSIQDLSALIKDMQISINTLQKKKLYLCQKEMKKKRKNKKS